MPRIAFTLCLLLFAASLSAQTNPTLQTGNFAGPFSISLSSSTSYCDLAKPKWDIIFQSLPNEADENLFHLKELKEEKIEISDLFVMKSKGDYPEFARMMLDSRNLNFISDPNLFD